MNKEDDFYTKEEEDMAVFSKPCNFVFQVAESKSEAFLKNDTKPDFKKTMEKFKKHGGKIRNNK